MRKLVVTFIPSRVLRWIDRRAERRFDAAAAPVRARYLAEHGSVVRRGPFEGLRCVERSAAVAKLVGSYEVEVHEAVRDLVSRRPPLVVNIGCGDGYFACGLARLLPDAQVQAYDIDEPTRELCAEQVALNGLQAQVVVAGECTEAMLAAMPSGGALVIDCEGAEADLLSARVATALARWPILVELHDFNVPGVTETIAERFAATHDVRLIDATDRAAFVAPELSGFTAAERAIALDEVRPAGMRWGYLVPRSPEG